MSEQVLNNLLSFTVSVIFIKPKSINPNIAIYNNQIGYGNFIMPNTPITINFGVPVEQFGFPGIEYNCFNGFTWVDLILRSGAITSHLILSGSDVTAINQSNINGIGFVTFCLAYCPVSYFIDGNLWTCVKCSEYIPYC